MVRDLSAAWNCMLIGSVGAAMAFFSAGIASGAEVLWVGTMAAMAIFILSFCQTLLSAGSVQPIPLDDGQDAGRDA